MLVNNVPNFWGWTQYTPVIPKLYWDVYSQEERIKRLCKELDKLCHYASYLAGLISANVDAIEAMKTYVDTSVKESEERVTKELNAYEVAQDEKLNELKIYVDEKFVDYAIGAMTYDVTTGSYRPSYESMRRLFQAITYDVKGDAQLVSTIANMKVSELANHTVYNVAYSDRATCVIDDQIN